MTRIVSVTSTEETEFTITFKVDGEVLKQWTDVLMRNKEDQVKWRWVRGSDAWNEPELTTDLCPEGVCSGHGDCDDLTGGVLL